MTEGEKRANLKGIKCTTVFLGVPTKEKPKLFATGFLIDVNNITYIVTAKHVIYNFKSQQIIDEDVVAYANLKNGKVGHFPFNAFKKDYGVDWLFHENPLVDVAMFPVPFSDVFDIALIPEDIFTELKDISELDGIFFLSYQPGVIIEKVSPIFRMGIISKKNEDKTYYVDATAFPGNSGSPVFLKPSTLRFYDEGVKFSKIDPLAGKFIGMIGSYLPYRDVAISEQTGQPRVIFEENTGLSIVWSVDIIKEIWETKKFIEMNEKIQKLIDKS